MQRPFKFRRKVKRNSMTANHTAVGKNSMNVKKCALPMFFPQVLPEIAITLKAILKSIFSYKSVTSKIVFFFFSLVL